MTNLSSYFGEAEAAASASDSGTVNVVVFSSDAIGGGVAISYSTTAPDAIDEIYVAQSAFTAIFIDGLTVSPINPYP